MNASGEPSENQVRPFAAPSPPAIYITADEVASIPESAIPRPARYLRVDAEQKPHLSGKAVAALAFGVFGVPAVGILLGWFALLFAFMAWRDLRKDATLKGEGMTIAATVLGLFDLALWAVLLTYCWLAGLHLPRG
jgi:hypothetical protein